MAYRVQVVPKRKRRAVNSTKFSEGPRESPAGESGVPGTLAKERLFSDLPPAVLLALEAICSPVQFEKDAVLFVEGREPRGVFILCSGRVKLSSTSADGKSIIVRMAEAGEAVGLAGTLSGQTCELTAEAVEPLQAKFIARDAFLLFLRQHGEAAVRVAELLSHIYHASCRRIARRMGMGRLPLCRPRRFRRGKGKFRSTSIQGFLDFG